METFKKILLLLTPNERKKGALLIVMILIMATIDAVGVASILPFVAVLTNPTLIETNIILNTMFHYFSFFGVKNKKDFFFVLGFLVFFFLVFSLIFKAATSYLQVRFVLLREYSIGRLFVERYLNQPYSWFLGRNSADLGKTILSEVTAVVGSVISPLMEIIARSFVVIALIILLLITNAKLTIIITIIIGGSYGVIFFSFRMYLNHIGELRVKNNNLRFRAVSEAFGAAKEIKARGLEKNYIKNYSKAAYMYNRNQVSAYIVSQLPRFFLEALAFGGMILIILYQMEQSSNFNNALPIISLYIFAGYRLMPAIQQIYSSFSSLTFTSPSLDNLFFDLKELELFEENKDKKILNHKKSINLKNVYFTYPNSQVPVLKNINLNIPAKSFIGIIGPTGSGKTTVVDIILGLLKPTKGTLEVDGKIITKKNVRSWQRTIGYVPQYIYLSDDTIAANIAFGIDSNDICQERVKKVSKIANMHDFIESELPKQYKTTVGERGVRLSGGQRQRIGIARALYHNPQLLILDEATNSLDTETEMIIMNAINNLNKEITVIKIAHRLNTLENCDIIFKIENGHLVAQGTLNKMLNYNK
jgi:ATP-binding cassette, subfamily B, bacterial PglK